MVVSSVRDGGLKKHINYILQNACLCYSKGDVVLWCVLMFVKFLTLNYSPTFSLVLLWRKKCKTDGVDRLWGTHFFRRKDRWTDYELCAITVVSSLVVMFLGTHSRVCVWGEYSLVSTVWPTCTYTQPSTKGIDCLPFEEQKALTCPTELKVSLDLEMWLAWWVAQIAV